MQIGGMWERRYPVALVGILLLGTVLRLYGIEWGMPSATHPQYSYHPDELPCVLLSERLFSGDLIPKHFMYGGTLYFAILNVCGYVAEWLSPVLGGVSFLADTLMVARHVMAIFSVLTIFLIYQTGRMLFDRPTGLLAALFLAISPVHIVLAQQARPDEPATFLVVLLAYVSARIFRADDAALRRNTLYAGVVLGLAVALRFPLGFFVTLPVAAYVWRDGWRMRTLLPRLLHRHMWTMAGIAVLTFCLTSPHSLLHFKTMMTGLRTTWKYESDPFPDAIGMGTGLYQVVWIIMQQALGVPMYWLTAVGVVWAGYRHTDAHKILIAAIVPYFVLSTFATWMVVRYALPLVPLLLLLAAVPIVDVLRSAGRLRYAAVAAAVAATLWTLMADAALLRVRAGPDVRDVTSTWIVRNLPPDSRLVTFWNYRDDVFFNPVIPENSNHRSFLLGRGGNLDTVMNRQSDYVIVNEFIYRNMERLGAGHPSAQTYALLQTLQAGGYQLVRQFKQPTTFLGIDFENNFTNMDYAVPNPGIRIYRYEPAHDDTPRVRGKAG